MRRAFAAAVLLALVACSKSEPVASPAIPPAQTLTNETQQAATTAKEGKEIDSPPPAALDGYRLSGPFTHGNLSVYLFHAKNPPQDDFGCVTLEEAFKSGAIKVTEKAEGAEVNELQVENTGDKPVYLQAGDTVKGGQQDRTIAVDTILPPKSGKKSIDAFCVEPGRWATRQGLARVELASAAAVFEESKAPVATNEQKLAIRLGKSQEQVWAAGKKVNEALASKSTPVAPAAGGRGPISGATFSLSEAKNSYVEAVEDANVQKKLAERIAALEKAPADQKDAVGAAFCVNGKIQGAEIYTAAGLFRKLWPKLLRSASVEAISKETDAAPAKAPTEAEIRALLAEVGARGGKAEVRPGGQTVRVFERDHAVLFDTEADGKLLHRQVLTK